jgi:hypothetical protein
MLAKGYTMRFFSLLLFVTLSYAAELSVPIVVELDSGASKGIAYSITRLTAEPDRIRLQLYNRDSRDIRVKYSIIPGAGDPIGDIQKTSIIRKESSWPLIGSGVVRCSFRKPGIRIDEIELGVIEEEEGYYYDAEGNETRSVVFKFIPDKK